MSCLGVLHQCILTCISICVTAQLASFLLKVIHFTPSVSHFANFQQVIFENYLGCVAGGFTSHCSFQFIDIPLFILIIYSFVQNSLFLHQMKKVWFLEYFLIFKGLPFLLIQNHFSLSFFFYKQLRHFKHSNCSITIHDTGIFQFYSNICFTH